MSDNSSDFGAFLAGFVIGGLVGAATALILAPQSGQEMRTQISNKGEEWRQLGAERAQHYREMAETYTNEYREQAEEIVTTARERATATSERLQEQFRIVLEPGNKTESTPETTAGSESEASTSD